MAVEWLPSLPYRPAETGYWDPSTSTIHWCEEKYYATHYIAEIVNASTNLLFLWLSIKGVRNCLKYDHPPIFLVTFAGYGFVGLSSFLFHSTLKYPMQLADELSMIVVTLIMMFASFTHFRSTVFALFFGAFLVFLALFIAIYYHYLQDPAFHQTAYGILTATVLLRSMFAMEGTLRPRLRPRGRDDIVPTMWKLVGWGMVVFLGGFAIWNLDNEFCSSAKSARNEIGLPWGIVLEGHGWWHIMTGYGAYCYIVWGIWLRACLEGEEDYYKLIWPRLLSVPEIQRTKPRERAKST